VKCQRCNKPLREDLADVFKRLDGTLVHTWCRTTQEFFETALGHPLEDATPEHRARASESRIACQTDESHQ
jgi:hypothetical protein